MKHLFLGLLLSYAAFTTGFAQTQVWEQKISEPIHPQFRSEYRDFAVAPNGNVYSVGFFRGNRAHFGSLTAYTDSARAKLFAGQTEPSSQTAFISCQAPGGNFLWVRSLSFDLGQFSITPPNSWIGDTYANRLALGPDGSLYVLGSGYGDTISFQEAIVHGAAPGTRHWGFFVLKVSQTGDFQWIKSLPYTPPPGGGIGLDPAFIQAASDQIHLIVSHDQPGLEVGSSTLSSRGQTRIRMGFDGSFLGTDTHTFPSNLLTQGGLPLLTRRLPDGKWVLGQYGTPAQDSASYLSILNPDFTLHSRIRVAALRSSDAPIPAVVMPVDYFPLSDSQNGLILSLVYASAIVVGNDTLDVDPGARSVFVKLSDFTCMKAVEEWDHYPQGINAVSANAHVYTFGHSTLGQIAVPANFRQYDRNGQLVSTLPVAELMGASANNYTTTGGIPPTFYKSTIIGTDLFLMRGTSLTKFQVSDPLVDDLSFSGCLSNRALLTGKSGLSSEPEPYRILPRGSEWQIDWLGSGLGELSLTNTRGQVLETRSLQAGTQVISNRNLANGLYFLHVKHDGKPKTHKVLVAR